MQQHIMQKMVTTEIIFSKLETIADCSHICLSLWCHSDLKLQPWRLSVVWQSQAWSVCDSKPSFMTSVNFHLPNDRLLPGSRWKQTRSTDLVIHRFPKGAKERMELCNENVDAGLEFRQTVTDVMHQQLWQNKTNISFYPNVGVTQPGPKEKRSHANYCLLSGNSLTELFSWAGPVQLTGIKIQEPLTYFRFYVQLCLITVIVAVTWNQQLHKHSWILVHAFILNRANICCSNKQLPALKSTNSIQSNYLSWIRTAFSIESICHQTMRTYSIQSICNLP